MSEEAPLSIKLTDGKTYPLVWGPLAKARMGSVPRTVFDLGGPMADFALIWCAVAVKPNPFPTWEHVAELSNAEIFAEMQKPLAVMFPAQPAQPDEQKKTTLDSSPSPDSASG